MIVNCQLKKSERLTSLLVIDKLFAGGNASMAAFPLRIVFMKMGEELWEEWESGWKASGVYFGVGAQETFSSCS